MPIVYKSAIGSSKIKFKQAPSSIVHFFVFLSCFHHHHQEQFMKWLNAVVKMGFDWHMRQALKAIEQPQAAQNALFQQLLAKGKQTSFGRQYDFASIQSIDSFRSRVPIHSYEMLQPYIHKMMQGKANILWPGKTTYFSRSSGTTNNRSKYIPVTKENLNKCHLRGGHDVISFWYYNNPTSKIFDGSRAIVMGGELSMHHPTAKTYVGDVSAIMLKHLPFYAEYFLTPDIPTALLSDWETKIERIAAVAQHQNVTNLSGVPTWTLVLFRKILEQSGKDSLSEVFPNFELYAHGGVDFAPYRSQFEALFPCQKVQYRNTYNASEGFFAAQFDKDDTGMQLLLDNGVFYEFIPMQEWGKEFPKTKTIHDVELGVNYAIVISTNAGLWRYAIGDTVQFTSLYPHQIQITGRTKQFINVFGEELMVANTEKALATTCQQTQAQVCEYTVAPIFFSQQNRGGHEWIVEFQKDPHNLQHFKQLLDQNLQNVNSDYEAKRYKDIALKELELKTVPKGSFHHWLKSKGKYGGQNKVPRLSNNRQYLEEILDSINYYNA